MSVVDAARKKLRGTGLKVVFPEGNDARIREAAAILAAEDLARPILLQTDDLPKGTAAAPDVEEATLIAPILAARPKLKPPVAAKMLAKPLYLGGALVAAGAADALVAGADVPTRRVIEAASLTIGLEPGAVASSFFLMERDGAVPLLLADCALNVAPDADTLAAIGLATRANALALLGAAHLAFLSYSTGDSGAGPSVDLVRSAVETARVRAPEAALDGPVQADAALNAGIAAKKGLDGAGDANVLIFPGLDAGNIAYKLMQELGGYQAIGPCLQGFARPVCDLSRGASVDDIVAATLVTLAQV